MIQVESVSKKFDALQAVDRVSFTARPGEIFGLLGPNGAGKSTIIRMLMNIIAPDSGEIFFDGRKTSEQDKDRIGYLPEERGLYKKDKVNDILLYFASLKNARMDRAQKNIDDWLERFGLTDRKFEKVEKLSKGMSQKIQFIASVAHDPDILFFDEPFAGLDPVSADLLKDSIAALGKEGKTILFSTHIMEHAEKICTGLLLINRGREVISGQLADIKSSYGTNTVAIEFDGNADFIAALPYVKKIMSFPRWIEVELSGRTYTGDLLRTLASKTAGGTISVSRFELMAPSLHNIFISLVGDKKETSHEENLQNSKT
ncbi:MAG: ATP-binding cassette domain-containing protein [Spirochaetales bacterium]|nr:MAG: ATP-binding cassette domain-containing protein [Spirochaetales bacterium]